MSSKYWLLFGSLTLGGAQTVACSSEFHSCRDTRTCPPAGAPGVVGEGGEAGEAGAEAGGTGGNASAGRGGSAGLEAQAGEAGTAGEAGSGGTAGDSNVDLELTIGSPSLAVGKTYVPFTGKLSASGATHYTWSISSGTLPAGLALQDAQSATVTIAGTPTEAGQFPLSLSVTDGTTTKTMDVTLAVTHSALFLSDRNTAGVNELFITELGAGSVNAPVRLNASLPSGGNITSYAWSPDGSKVLYLATQSSGGAAELWVASLATPGTAQRVSAQGVNVSKMVWLRAGNIGAYLTSVGDAYLVDLSASIPGTAKLVVHGGGTPVTLAPSPNGTSLTVTISHDDSSNHITILTVTYVTWAPGTPTAVEVYTSGYSDPFPYLSYDGRLGIATRGGLPAYWDLSLASPTATSLPAGGSAHFVWSPNAQDLLFDTGGGAPDSPLYLGVFENGSLTSTTLVSGCFPSPGSWSTDGKNVLFGCKTGLRGISNVSPAAIGSDFSLLPSGFLSNAFTDTQSVSWSPDSKWIALRADRDVDAQYDLQLIRWSAPGVAYKPHANSIGAGVSTWAFAPNSQSLALIGSIAPQSNAGLYLTKLPASGAPPTATLISAPATAVVQTDINWLPGSRMLTYRATASGSAQLFAVPVGADGTAGTAIPVSGVSGTGVSSYQLAPTH